MEIQGFCCALNYYVAQRIDVVILGEGSVAQSASVAHDGECPLRACNDSGSHPMEGLLRQGALSPK